MACSVKFHYGQTRNLWFTLRPWLLGAMSEFIQNQSFLQYFPPSDSALWPGTYIENTTNIITSTKYPTNTHQQLSLCDLGLGTYSACVYTENT